MDNDTVVNFSDFIPHFFVMDVEQKVQDISLDKVKSPEISYANFEKVVDTKNTVRFAYLSKGSMFITGYGDNQPKLYQWDFDSNNVLKYVSGRDAINVHSNGMYAYKNDKLAIFGGKNPHKDGQKGKTICNIYITSKG